MVSEIIKNLGSIVQEKTGNDPAVSLTDRLKKIGKGALAVASGRAIPYAIGKAGEKIFSQPTDEEVKMKEAEVMKKEVLGQIELNTKMGWNSDTMGNPVSRIEGFNEEEALKKGLEGSKKGFNPAEKVSDVVIAGVDKVKDIAKKGIKKTGEFADKVINGDTVTWEAPQPKEMIGAAIQGPMLTETKAETKAVPKKDNIVFQESGVGSGIPYVDTGTERVRIDQLDFNPPETQRIKRLIIKNKRSGEVNVIEDPEKVSIANEIKRYSDAVAPEYTDYLLRLAQREGVYDRKARNYNGSTTGEKGVDRGIFQINSKHFPDVTDAMADDVKFSVLWALSLIEAGKQDKWYADPHVKDSVTDIEYDTTEQTQP